MRGIIVFTDDHQLHCYFDRTQKPGEMLSAITHKTSKHLIAYLQPLRDATDQEVTHILIDPSLPNVAV